MSLETFLSIFCLLGAAVCFIAARFLEPKITYVEQKAWEEKDD